MTTQVFKHYAGIVKNDVNWAQLMALKRKWKELTETFFVMSSYHFIHVILQSYNGFTITKSFFTVNTKPS